VVIVVVIVIVIVVVAGVGVDDHVVVIVIMVLVVVMRVVGLGVNPATGNSHGQVATQHRGRRSIHERGWLQRTRHARSIPLL
jgi:hypothetical protein